MKHTLQWLLTGGLVPPLLICFGLFFLLYLRGRPLLSPRKMLQALRRPSSSGVSPFRAVTLALAGTLGVGNIVGVANALLIGGAGAVFWMWVSALVAMILKYAEILLAVRHRRLDPQGGFCGGAVYYIRDFFTSFGWARFGVILSVIFALLTALDAMTMGCIIQVNAVSSAMEGVAEISPALCGAGMLLLTLPVIAKGAKGISAVTEYLVPIMSLGYILLSAVVLMLRADALPTALALIFRDAFSPESAAGGVLGFLSSRALRVGTMRGLLSNEAGCGTAPTAHACADTDSPAAQGVWGIFEVFVDTILLCTATALVILVNLPAAQPYADNAVMMTIRAYTATLGNWAGYFFCAAILCFAYATVICWASYGLEALQALSRRRRWKYLYLALFLLCIPLGAMTALDAVWQIADFAIAALTTVNLILLFFLRREVRTETDALFPLPKVSRQRQKGLDNSLRKGYNNRGTVTESHPRLLRKS